MPGGRGAGALARLAFAHGWRPVDAPATHRTQTSVPTGHSVDSALDTASPSDDTPTDDNREPTVAKTAKTDRQAKIDQIRSKQKGAEKRRGFMIVGVCVVIALLIVGAAAYQPIKDWWELREFEDLASPRSAPPPRCARSVETKPADRQPRPRPARHPGALRGLAPGLRPALERAGLAPARSTASSTPRATAPTLESLVHNLEHGYTILWYDETIADDDEADARAARHRRQVHRRQQLPQQVQGRRRGRPRTASRSPTASTSR